MDRRRVAIACQGGGSQCAFVAGALKALFAARIQDRYEIVGLSGTSGGAFTAALAWAGLLKQSHGDPTPIEDAILACWADLTAQTSREMGFDFVSVELLRMIERGALPSFAMSPASIPFKLFAGLASAYIARPAFTDLRALLTRHIDFDELARLYGPESPALLVGAVDVLDGSFKVFSSWRGDISLDALLASAAIPTLFPAAWVGGHAYWDGIFSSNPPVLAFLKQRYVGRGCFPQEIWVIQVNRTRHDHIPELPSDILDRRNHLAGNLSLQHELDTIEIVNFFLAHNAITDEFRARFGIDVTDSIQVRFIRMSRPLEESLDYPSKLSRQPEHIARLMADGEAQGRAFLSELS